MRAHTIASMIACCTLSLGAAHSTPGRESTGRTRTYFIAADTVTWDYVPGRGTRSQARRTPTRHSSAKRNRVR